MKQNQRAVSGSLATASQYTYTVDNLPRRTAVSFSGDAFSAAGSVDWAYNTSGEVQSADHSVNTQDRFYQYDSLGNRERSRDGVTGDSGGTLTSYTPTNLNQYSAVTGAVSVNPSYDDDGNQLTGVLPVSPATASGYTWNAKNELIEVKSGSPLTTLATYKYDPFGRRIMRDTGDTKIWFFYDGWNLIAEHNNSGTLQRAHTWGLDLSGSLQGAGGVGGLLASSILGVSFYPFYDGNGNITQYVKTSGEIDAHYEYDPFGRFTAAGDNPSRYNFRFSSKYYDTQTGLLYYGYRYYDPLMGRWLSRDPLEETGGLNTYSFALNNSISRIDNYGLQSWIPNYQPPPSYRPPSGQTSPSRRDQLNPDIPGSTPRPGGELRQNDWFERRYAGWKGAMESSINEMMEAELEKACSSGQRPGSFDLSKLNREVTPTMNRSGVSSSVPRTAGNANEQIHGDSPQSAIEADQVLGRFWFKVPSVRISWYTDSRGCICYTWEADLVVEDGMGANPGDPIHSFLDGFGLGSGFREGELPSLVFPERREVRARWTVDGQGCCEPKGSGPP